MQHIFSVWLAGIALAAIAVVKPLWTSAMIPIFCAAIVLINGAAYIQVRRECKRKIARIEGEDSPKKPPENGVFTLKLSKW